MHFKTFKCKKLSFDQERNTKKDQGMLDLTKTHFPINFHTFMMINGHDFNRNLMFVWF